MKPRIVVLISGSGTNLQALMDAVQNGSLEAEIALVVTNRKAAFGLVRAKNAGIPTLYFPLKPYKDAGKSREEYDADLAKTLEPHNPDLLVLAGWMHIDSGVLCQTFLGRIINLHPALPNEFAGAHAIEDAFSAWQRGEISRSGCMVHHVIPELDAGEAIVTREVPLIEGDTLETFATRVHVAEHEIIVEATKKILQELKYYASLITFGIWNSVLFEEIKKIFKEQASDEVILQLLKSNGFNRVHSIAVFRFLKKLPLAEASALVGLSDTWAEEREREKFRPEKKEQISNS